MNKKKLISISIIVLMIVSTLVAIAIPSEASESKIGTVRGYLYIDDEGVVSLATEGVKITLSFDSGDETDFTNVNGHYEFDFPMEPYIAQTGYYTVTVNGWDYAALDEFGNIAKIDIEEQYIYSLNLYITLINVPPVAYAGGPYSATLGDSISFDGSGSYDLDGTITTWSWDFGDGNIGSGKTISYKYGSTGTYTVKLKVTDNEGATQNHTTTATISKSGGNSGGNNGGSNGGSSGGSSGDGGYSGDGGVATVITSPLADAGGDENKNYYGVVNEEITLSGSVIGGTQPFTCEWDLDNDGEYKDGTGTNPKYTWTETGTYTIKFRVTDANNKIDTDVANVIISLANTPPYNLTIDGILEGSINLTYNYSAVAEDDDLDDSIKYGIDWDNDDLVDEWTEFKTPGELVTISHKFTTAGLYIVKAQAEDKRAGNSGWSNRLLVFIDVDYYLGNDGKYYIDIDKDEISDQVYDPELGSLTDYEPEDGDTTTTESNENINQADNTMWYLLGFIFVMFLIGAVFFGTKTKEKPKKKAKK